MFSVTAAVHGPQDRSICTYNVLWVGTGRGAGPLFPKIAAGTGAGCSTVPTQVKATAKVVGCGAVLRLAVGSGTGHGTVSIVPLTPAGMRCCADGDVVLALMVGWLFA